MISEPNDAELAWVREHVEATSDFAAQFGLSERPSIGELDALAVYREAGDITVFPANLVAKRWETRDTGFLRPVYDGVAKLAETD